MTDRTSLGGDKVERRMSSHQEIQEILMQTMMDDDEVEGEEGEGVIGDGAADSIWKPQGNDEYLSVQMDDIYKNKSMEAMEGGHGLDSSEVLV